jgi:MoaA/NifB/PqqE/SkfB family radical SAM enzyme
MIPLRNFKRFFQKALRQPGYAVRVAAKRLGAYLSYLVGAGRANAPEAVTFFLTRACNLRCKMCGQWGDYGITKKDGPGGLRDGLSLEEIKAVVTSIKPVGSSVTLFGGEPFLHPGIILIIEAVKKSGLHCLVITNGTLLERFANEVVAAGLDELNISIDGGKELHGEIRGLSGVFDEIMAGIGKVNQAKKDMRSARPFINIQCTISKYNVDHLEQLLDVARAARARSLTFHNLIFLRDELIQKQKAFDDKLGCSSRDWEGFVFEPGIDPEMLYKKIEEVKVKAEVEEFSVDIYPNFSKKGLVEYYLNPDYLPSEYAPRCASPWICAYVFPDGEVRPCLNCSYSYGNVKTADFMKIWNSPEAVRYRQALKKEGIFPACRRCTELYRY